MIWTLKSLDEEFLDQNWIVPHQTIDNIIPEKYHIRKREDYKRCISFFAFLFC